MKRKEMNSHIMLIKVSTDNTNSRQRPYHAEYTGSRPITEVKQHRAWSVLGWVTAWEHQVLLASFIFHNIYMAFRHLKPR